MLYQLSRLEEHKKLGGGTARTADPNWPMGYPIPCDIPYHVTSCSVYKSWGKKKEGGMFGVVLFVFPSHRYT